jgi:hypothetical protein
MTILSIIILFILGLVVLGTRKMIEEGSILAAGQGSIGVGLISVLALFIGGTIAAPTPKSDKRSEQIPPPPTGGWKPAESTSTKPDAVPPSPLPVQAGATEVATTPLQPTQNVIPTPPAATTTASAGDYRSQQAAYQRAESIILRYASAYGSAPNEIAKTDMRYQRGRDLCTIGSPYWGATAQIKSIMTDKAGNATVHFTTTGGVELLTNNEVKPTDSAHAKLAHMALGQMVNIQFSFRPDGKDCFYSERWTEEGNMTHPRFFIHLIDVA